MNSLSAEVCVRRMAAEDLARMIAIEQSLKDAPHWGLSAYLSALDPKASPRRIVLVAEVSQTGAVVGFAVASLLPPQAELETIAVAAEAQRCGVARQLFAKLAEELRKAQAMELLLEVRASNYPVIAFYRALGFAQTGSRPRYYADPIEDAVLMRLPLE